MADEPYRLRDPGRVAPVLYTLGGLACGGLGLLLFGVQLLLPPENKTPFPVRIMSTVLPLLGGFALLGQGRRLGRRVTEVEVRPKGLIVTSPSRTRTLRWSEVARLDDATVQVAGGFGGQTLAAVHLIGHDGKPLMTLTDELDGFDDLRARVRAAVLDQAGPAAGEPKSKANKLVAVGFGLFAVFLTFAYVFVAVDTRHHQVNDRLLAEDGVTVDADISKHERFWQACRVEYRFTAAGTVYERGTVLPEAYWRTLAGADTVPVRYVRTNPEYSRVEAGEVDDGPSLKAPLGYLLAVVGLPLSGLMAVAAYLRWTGRESVKIGPATIKV